MKNRALHKEKTDPNNILSKALIYPELASLLKPYLHGESFALSDVCEGIVKKQDTISKEEIMVLLLQEYLRRAK